MPSSNIDLINDQQRAGKLQSIDDQIYLFDVWMYNQIEGQDPFQVPFLMIDSLSVEEGLLDWNTKGWLVINNDYEILEKYFPNTTKAPLIFRTDGRNRMRIQIYPVFNTSQNFLKLENEEDVEVRKKWEICVDAVIYDVEDIDVPNAKNKKRKLYFHTEAYQLFLEKNMEWSTAVEGRKEFTPDGDISDQQVCRANIALRSIIREAGKTPTGEQINIGWESYPGGESSSGSIDKPNIPVKPDLTSWELGTKDNNIFYTSPAYSNVVEDIKYVLDYCGTKEKGPSILELGRWEKDKTFKLLGLKDYFDDVKRNEQVEHLIIEDGVLEEGNIDPEAGGKRKPYFPKAPNTESNQVKNFISGRASIIKNYRFAPMVSSDDSRICTTPLHQLDFSTGKFKIQFTDNKIDDVQSAMTNYVKDTLYSFSGGGSNDAHFLLNINKTKKDGIMLHNHFEPLQYMPKFLPQTNMIRDSLFLNECISFLVPGLTIRAPGRFIFIDKFSSSADPNPHDDRFLGQWLIIKVVHFFQQGHYLSEVTATKVDTFRKLWDKEDKK